MSKHRRKDVVKARIIFGTCLFFLIAIIVMIISLSCHNTKEKNADTQTETETELEYFNEAFENIDTTTEETETEVVYVWTTAELRLRQEPSLEAEILEVLPKDTKLIVISEEEEWTQVEYEDETGYVSSEYITTEDPDSQEAQTASSADNGYVVVIDPGHQAKGDSTKEPNGPGSSEMKARVTQGTSGVSTGVAEYVLTLDVSLQLKKELQRRGYTVYMTRETHDINISNMERAQYATEVGADIAVRIHADGAESSQANGACTLYPSSSNKYVANLSADSKRLSQNVLDAYCSATGMKNRGTMANDTMTGINWSTVPVTILEMGFMTNATDDVNMQNAEYQTKMVTGIANGIDAYFGR